MQPERTFYVASRPCQAYRKTSYNGWAWGLLSMGSLKFRQLESDGANGESDVKGWGLSTRDRPQGGREGADPVTRPRGRGRGGDMDVSRELTDANPAAPPTVVPRPTACLVCSQASRVSPVSKRVQCRCRRPPDSHGRAP